MSFDFENERVAEYIRKMGAKRVLLQLPDGLKKYGPALAYELENRLGVTVIVSGDPCYGGCDLALDDARRFNVDAIVHYGHSKFTLEETPNVLYVPVQSNIDPIPVVEEALKSMGEYRYVGLTTTLQHASSLAKVTQYLEGVGKRVFVGKGGSHVEQPGQILGCDYAAAKAVADKVDVFLHVGGGDFHPLGVVLATGKPVVAADPYLGVVKDLTAQGLAILRRRRASIANLLEAKRVGIIMSSKSHQSSLTLALELKQRFEVKHQQCTLILSREIVPETLDNYLDIDVFVNVACPRIGVDDADRYSRPILNAVEAMWICENSSDRQPCI